MWRIVICCFIHPVLLELVLTQIRCQNRRAHVDITSEIRALPIVQNHSFVGNLMPFGFMVLMAIIRRFMISQMSAPFITTLAIVITGLEEVFLRFTIVQRDAIYLAFTQREKKNKKESTDRFKMVRNVVWMTSACHEMIAEILAILIRVSCVLLLKNHRSILALVDIKVKMPRCFGTYQHTCYI